jgi:hypothetical protein
VLELHADPLGADVRLLFTADPPDTLIVLAVLEGPDAVDEHWHRAVTAVESLAATIRAAGWPDDLGPEVEYADTAGLLAGLAPGHRVAVTQRAAAIRAATRLADLRAAQGRSLAELAGLTGLSEEALASMERDGLREVPVEELAAYVRALGGRLELTAILGGEHRILP